MSGLDVFALFILLVLALTGLGAVVFLANWPGKVAQERSHRHWQAIQIGGWVTLIAGGVFWPLVLIWAYMDDPEVVSTLEIDDKELSQ